MIHPLFWRRMALGLLAAFSLVSTPHAADTLTHVHGLTWSADGKRLLIPSHHGLAVYENGKWSKAPGEQHDYMGFSGTAKFVYSSGHPASGSSLVNPFGLIRSKDGGRTWDKLGLEGETDFHLLAAGWNTNAIYVWNSVPSSRMKGKGLYSTLNDGLLWKPARAGGLAGDPRALAVHPVDTGIVAAATAEGVFLSHDAGERFTRVGNGAGTGVFFDLDGKHLWYGSFDGAARLSRAPLRRGGPDAIFSLPPLTQDAVAYIAQNPMLHSEYAIATYGRNVYLSVDAGRTWKAIAERGQGK